MEDTTMPIEEAVAKTDLMFVQQPTRDFLERYFAEKVLSIKQGLDEVYEPKPNNEGDTLTQLQSIKAFWNICRTEVEEMVELFGSTKAATMHPNHRKIMVITKHFNNLLKSNDLIKEEDENSANCMRFAEWAIDYLTTLHNCLINYENKKLNIIKDKEKRELVEAFCEHNPVIREPIEDGKKKKRTRKATEA
jgi:hypothetical protein